MRAVMPVHVTILAIAVISSFVHATHSYGETKSRFTKLGGDSTIVTIINTEELLEIVVSNRFVVDWMVFESFDGWLPLAIDRSPELAELLDRLDAASTIVGYLESFDVGTIVAASARPRIAEDGRRALLYFFLQNLLFSDRLFSSIDSELRCRLLRLQTESSAVRIGPVFSRIYDRHLVRMVSLYGTQSDVSRERLDSFIKAHNPLRVQPLSSDELASVLHAANSLCD